MSSSPFQWFCVSGLSPSLSLSLSHSLSLPPPPPLPTVLSITSTPIVCVVLTRRGINWVLLMPAFWSASFFWAERACVRAADSLHPEGLLESLCSLTLRICFFFAVSAMCNKGCFCYWNAVKTPQFMWKKNPVSWRLYFLLCAGVNVSCTTEISTVS